MAAQLAIYLGFVHYRLLGATLVGFAFVLPSFLMVVALGFAYAHFGGLSWMQAVFYGVGAAVVGIIAMSASPSGAAVTFITESEIAWLFVAAGLIGWLLRAPPKWLHKGGLNAVAAAHLPAASGLLSGIDLPQLVQIGAFFMKAGAFVFGSGLAIVPFSMAASSPNITG